MTDQLPGDDCRAAMCLQCTHCYKNYDGLQCDLDPHGNPEEHRGMIAWLMRPYFQSCPMLKRIPTTSE